MIDLRNENNEVERLFEEKQKIIKELECRIVDSKSQIEDKKRELDKFFSAGKVEEYKNVEKDISELKRDLDLYSRMLDQAKNKHSIDGESRERICSSIISKYKMLESANGKKFAKLFSELFLLLDEMDRATIEVHKLLGTIRTRVDDPERVPSLNVQMYRGLKNNISSNEVYKNNHG